MEKDFIKIVMEPNRLRIIQCLLLQEEASVAQMKPYLSDIPQATLYRHIKTLEDADCIVVVRENRIRGAVEKIYQLNQNPFEKNPGNQEMKQMVQMMMLQIMGDFANYFETKECSLEKDMYGISTCNLLLTDEEFIDLNKKLGEVFQEVLQNKPEEGRKERRISFINSPIPIHRRQ